MANDEAELRPAFADVPVSSLKILPNAPVMPEPDSLLNDVENKPPNSEPDLLNMLDAVEGMVTFGVSVEPLDALTKADWRPSRDGITCIHAVAIEAFAIIHSRPATSYSQNVIEFVLVVSPPLLPVLLRFGQYHLRWLVL